MPDPSSRRDGDKPDRYQKPVRLIFPFLENDLPGFGYLAGLIFRLDPSDPSAQRDRDRLNGIESYVQDKSWTPIL
jgi:hypothetical protein